MESTGTTELKGDEAPQEVVEKSSMQVQVHKRDKTSMTDDLLSTSATASG